MIARGALLAAAALTAACGGEAPAAEPQPQASESAASADSRVVDLAVDDVAALVAAGEVQLIDVRSPEEFAEGHIDGAVNRPVDGFNPSDLPAADGREVVLYCRSDRRSGIAARQLADYTGKPARHLDGGILAWQAAGQPVTAPTAE